MSQFIEDTGGKPSLPVREFNLVTCPARLIELKNPFSDLQTSTGVAMGTAGGNVCKYFSLGWADLKRLQGRRSVAAKVKSVFAPVDSCTLNSCKLKPCFSAELWVETSVLTWVADFFRVFRPTLCYKCKGTCSLYSILIHYFIPLTVTRISGFAR